MSAQNPANVKIITEPLLPQPQPIPGGRILRPIETPGYFDSSIIGDPVLEKGLSYIGNRGSTSTRAAGSSSGSDSDEIPLPPLRRPPISSIRGGVGTAIGSSSRPSAGGGDSSSAGVNNLSGTGKASYGRELSAGNLGGIRGKCVLFK